VRDRSTTGARIRVRVRVNVGGDVVVVVAHVVGDVGVEGRLE
jgi:hypothetical protein